MDYWLAITIATSSKIQIKRNVLVLSIVINLALLAYYKYAGFLASNLGIKTSFFQNIALPLGISFFTFHKISYLIDVYRGTSQPARNLVQYLLYILFFPQLIAGPIIRYHEIAEQLLVRNITLNNIFFGWGRFVLGLAKKVVIADSVGAIVDELWQHPTNITTEYAWIAVFAYSFQIYFDFSGYSDMAIGLARIIGFTFPENFNMPYLAKNFTDFWQRWHISLSRWMKEYLYLPLGGNRVGILRQIVNLWIVFLLSGLWHGAQWNFVAWGIFHGVFLSLDKSSFASRFKKLPDIMLIAITFFLVTMSWVLFRAPNMATAISMYRKLFGLATDTNIITKPIGLVATNQQLFWLCISPIIIMIAPLIKKHFATLGETAQTSLVSICGLVGFLYSVILTASTDFSPFIYFQF